jgi:hypothetical protein
VRPERDNIAAPELPGRIKWLNRSEPPKMAELTATGPVLVHFTDPFQLNSVRALPYLAEWNRRYAGLGLTILAIHSPRFTLTADGDVATEAIERLGIEHPVALDLDYAIWQDYGCKGWPSLFLWGRGGALRWAHQGEGEYQATEEAIQEELRLADVTADLPAPMEPLRPTDAPGALMPPPTPEAFPGGSATEPWTPEPGGSEMLIEYAGGEAWVVIDGAGTIMVAVDDEPTEVIEVPPAALAKLAGSGLHEQHSVRLGVSEGVRIWAASFAPGAP